jgi:hypothetical protein
MVGRHGGNQGGGKVTHGLSKHPLHYIWLQMRARCYREAHHAFSDYGGRGVIVCAEWRNDFMSFYNDMAPTYRPGLTLERKNNTLGYNKENCVWADWKTQARNRRNNKTIDTPVGRMLLCEAVELSGLKTNCLVGRLKAGWPVEHLFDPPNRGRRISVLGDTDESASA